MCIFGILFGLFILTCIIVLAVFTFRAVPFLVEIENKKSSRWEMYRVPENKFLDIPEHFVSTYNDDEITFSYTSREGLSTAANMILEDYAGKSQKKVFYLKDREVKIKYFDYSGEPVFQSTSKFTLNNHTLQLITGTRQIREWLEKHKDGYIEIWDGNTMLARIPSRNEDMHLKINSLRATYL